MCCDRVLRSRFTGRRGICRVREIDGVRDIQAIGSCTETTRNTVEVGISNVKTRNTGDKDPNTHQAHAGCIGSTDNM